MPHPLVEQLRFARSEFARGLEGLADDQARQRLGPMNSISWTVGHLAWQENRYWLIQAQGRNEAPELEGLVGYRQPASTPPLEEMWAAWRRVTAAADPFLDGLDSARLTRERLDNIGPGSESLGSKLLRVIYHYWYHLGEAMAVRQLLQRGGGSGQPGLPQFVGDIEGEAPYRFE